MRAAVEADAPAIARVHVAAWREAYVRQLPAELLAGLDVERRAAAWETIISEGRTNVRVAEIDGQLIGWASAGAGRDADGPAPIELEGIYVLAAAYGIGLGQRLLDAAIGSSPAYLWVMADNPRAHAFYRRNGFVADGSIETQVIGGVPVEIVRLVRGR